MEERSAATRKSACMRAYVLLVASVAALGGLLFGYDTGVISGAILFITKDFALAKREQAFTISVVLIGCIAGSAVAGTIADRIGRRLTLLLAGVVFFGGAIVSAFTPNEAILLCGRFIVGIGIGFSSVVAPLYISEVAPANVRGALVSLYQFAITVGILAAYLVDYALAAHGQWRWMLGLAVIPSLVLVGGMLVMPESPRYLFKMLLGDRARDELLRIYPHPAERAQEEESIEESLRAKQQGWEALREPMFRTALFIGVTLAVLQQITGINTVIYYGPQIFQMAGIGSASASILAQTLVGTVNCGMTLSRHLLRRQGRTQAAALRRTGRHVRGAGDAGDSVRAAAPLRVARRHRARQHDALRRLLRVQPRPDRVAADLGDLPAARARARHVDLDAEQLGRQLPRLAVLSHDGRTARAARAPSPSTRSLCIVTILFVRAMVPETKRELLERIRVRPA